MVRGELHRRHSDTCKGGIKAGLDYGLRLFTIGTGRWPVEAWETHSGLP